MFEELTWRWAIMALAAFLGAVALIGTGASAAGGHGIEQMTAEDWKGMWGFEKRGLSECWLAGTRHQATRTLAELKKLEPQLGPQSPARQRVRAMQDELETILACQLTPKQLEESVNRFYEEPANAGVLLGDALHFVVVDGCGGANSSAAAR